MKSLSKFIFPLFSEAKIPPNTLTVDTNTSLTTFHLANNLPRTHPVQSIDGQDANFFRQFVQ